MAGENVPSSGFYAGCLQNCCRLCVEGKGADQKETISDGFESRAFQSRDSGQVDWQDRAPVTPRMAKKRRGAQT